MATTEEVALEPRHARDLAGSADVCVVVPMFDEAPVVGSVVADLTVAFPHVVCVDDGSRDGSAEIAEAAGANVVRHPDNLGAGAAIQTGIEYALSRWAHVQYVLTFDADGQHRVADGLKMLNVARETGIGVVLGSRSLRSNPGMPFTRAILLKAGVLFTRATTGLHLTDTHCGLRVLRRDVAESLNLLQPGMAHASELMQIIARRHITYTEVPVDVVYSSYSRQKGQRAVNGINILFDLAVNKLGAVR